MKYNYEEIIKDLNLAKIKSIVFAIKNYSHYKKCTINRDLRNILNDKCLSIIEVKLTEYESEKVFFYKKFKENYKLFKMG